MKIGESGNHAHRSEPIARSRRWILSTVGASTVLAGLVQPGDVHSAEHSAGRILQPDTSGDLEFIQRAFEMRRLAGEYGDRPYGAVVVLRGKIIGQSWSRVILDHDPTGHAEMSAMRDAARRLKVHDLSGATLYSSSRPCSMCEAAAAWCGIVEMMFGEQARSAGTPRACR